MALCLAFSFTPLLSKAQTLDPTQVYNTGNIVQNTPQGGPTPWVNGVYQDNLTCWGWGDPGYCGPNAIVRPSGSINFSFGTTNLYQMQAIANVLPNTGTGLAVNGYNFGFTAKNGNGWDDARMDYLTAYVSFYDPKGSTVFNKNYDLNSRFNWTTFNYSETFNTPFASKDLGSVQYGFVGRDNNGWAGPYGPEIYNVNFSLKYSVDPCATNPLYSPTCPGYLEALAKLAPAPPPVVAEAPPPPPMIMDSNPISMIGQPLPPPGSPPVADATQPPAPAGPAPAGAPPPPGPAQQVASTQPAPSGQQTKVGEVSDSSGGSKSTVSLSSVLNMIGSNQEKTAALEKSVVQAADAQAFSAGEAAKQNAEKVAGDAQTQSITAGGSGSSSSQTSSTQSASFQTPGSVQSMQSNPQFNNVANSNRIMQQSASAGIVQSEVLNFNATNQQQSNSQSNVRQDFNVAMVTPSSSYSLVTPARQSQQVQVEMPTLEGIKFGYRGPVDSAMESKPFLPQMNSGSEQNASVKKNVQNNEAAGNVTIESIAKQPANYAQYFTVIPDVAFYAPKEIYKNQKTVDNARTLRGLQGGSDKLHQEMINQQYK